MAQKNFILCIDIGGDSIKAAEFSYVPGQSLNLERFAYTEYEFSSEEPPEDIVLKTLSDVIKTNRFSARDVYISLSGKNAFVRFVKIPAMTTDKNKIREIISYEAKQAIPFPPDDIVWDAQVLQPTPESDGSEIDAMIVIVKKQEVSRISELVEKLGKRIALIEVAGTSCYNSARANSVGASECQMILDIGGRCSTLVFIDDSRFFVRTIPIAGDTITQQIAKEFNISYADAEEMKRKHGYVSLGGAYEESESEVASAVSKIVRNVMTRLHGEINRSINVYRATQKGRKPEKLFLAGGSSILPYAPRFFSEKLRIPVDYLNPFQVVGIGPAVDQEVLSEVAHLFAETIGLALRRIGTSPVEISLVPDYIRKEKEFRAKRPYFLFSAIAVILYLVITLWAFGQQANTITGKREQFQSEVAAREIVKKNVESAQGELVTAQDRFKAVVTILNQRNNFMTFYSLVRTCIPDNVWLTNFEITNAPPKNLQTLKAKADAGESVSSAKKDEDEDGDSDEEQEEQKPQQEQEDSTTWINMTAFVISGKNTSADKSSDRDTAFNNILSQMNKINKAVKNNSENAALGGIFKSARKDILQLDDDGTDVCDKLSVRKFYLSVELTAKIDSPEMEEMLSAVFAAMAPEKKASSDDSAKEGAKK